jgi:hypothetical protein
VKELAIVAAAIAGYALVAYGAWIVAQLAPYAGVRAFIGG